MKILLLDLGISNILSVYNGLRYITNDIEIISNYSSSSILQQNACYVLPGVGSFDAGISALTNTGMDKLIRIISSERYPLIGICLGMQLLLDTSDESLNGSKGLGIVPGEVKMLNRDYLKVPNIGWRKVDASKNSNYSKYLQQDFYFVHSYSCHVPPEYMTSSVTIDNRFAYTSSYKYRSIHGFQFHPEKSQLAGIDLLANLIQSF